MSHLGVPGQRKGRGPPFVEPGREVVLKGQPDLLTALSSAVLSPVCTHVSGSYFNVSVACALFPLPVIQG